ncbi:MAG: putative manganese transporter [Bacteroidales bacterium]|jgi:MFS family permease|nr:putative manganese transporter [Bacteroidales bacterium]MDD2263996.1 putative manganese transporter [Bacteroidales bacterium]MDD2831230.1 putative manganese transporter [Bacteroidales bacterium]MDD3208657.1 putative manganese transporter [Bacteroidales bacterium]MDD3697220.1 putative manganese transporter [Bacteroidales bacterium]
MWFLEIIKQSVLITGLVMVMMILIEYINVTSKGSLLKKLQNRPVLQIFLSALLGTIPGCSGGFVVVSLYAHNLVSFGALIAMMIATVGDEAFLMLAMIPGTSLLLFAILFVLAIAAGFLTDRLIRKVPRPFGPDHFRIHQEDPDHEENLHMWGDIRNHFKPLRWQRLILFLGLGLFFVSIALGLLEHGHHAHEHNPIFSERWLNLIFAGLSLLTLIFTLFASNHFVEKHIWDHIVKHHFLKIFLWTFGTLIIIQLLMMNIDLNVWIKEKFWIVLPVAILVGIIPASGPHLIFVTLFASGTIPFSILLANSIVQDGHAGLPLLAETKKGFFIAKALKIVIAVTVAAAIQLIYSL